MNAPPNETNGWETVIGLEIHAQLATRAKIFSGSATAYGAPPNAQADLVDLGYPGVLPVLNGAAVRMAVLFGLAIEARIAPRSVFARKNYFYPDLPKGYQISQYELPIVAGGHVDIMLDDGSARRIGVTRAHLEEDAGKSLHEGLPGLTGIDLNRAGTPLLEIVSEPEMRSARESIYASSNSMHLTQQQERQQSHVYGAMTMPTESNYESATSRNFARLKQLMFDSSLFLPR